MTTLSVSLDDALISEFDETIAKHGYSTRSSAISEAMRNFIEKLNERAVLKMKVNRRVSS